MEPCRSLANQGPLDARERACFPFLEKIVDTYDIHKLAAGLHGYRIGAPILNILVFIWNRFVGTGLRIKMIVNILYISTHSAVNVHLKDLPTNLLDQQGIGNITE